MNNNYISLSDIKKLETKIDDIYHYDEKIFISFKNCNLRPTAGGQLYDKGKFYNGTWWDIKEVIQKNNKILCWVDAKENNFKVNDTVLIDLDYKRRNAISRMHSAIHLISYLNTDKMTSGHAGYAKSRIDFKGDIKKFEKLFPKIRNNFQNIIKQRKKIIVKYLRSSEIKNVKEFYCTNSLIYRVVEIENYGTSMCYGTHVNNTEEIGEIFFDEPISVKDDIYKINLYI